MQIIRIYVYIYIYIYICIYDATATISIYIYIEFKIDWNVIFVSVVEVYKDEYKYSQPLVIYTFCLYHIETITDLYSCVNPADKLFGASKSRISSSQLGYLDVVISSALDEKVSLIYIFIYLYLSISISVYMSISISISISLSISVSISTYLSIYLWMYLDGDISLYLALVLSYINDSVWPWRVILSFCVSVE